MVADLFNVARNRGEAAGDRYHGIENLYGTRKGGDELYGNDVANTLKGDGGDDKLYGRGGNDRLYGGADRDTLYGGAGDDTLEGGAGKDTLYLGGGSDTVVFGRGDGHDTVAADGFDAASTDKVVFGSGVKSDDLWFEESGDDLKISVVGESDSLTLKDWFKSPASAAGRMDEFRLSSGEILIESRVQELVEKMAGWARDHGAGPASLGELPDDETAYRAFTSALETAWQSAASG